MHVGSRFCLSSDVKRTTVTTHSDHIAQYEKAIQTAFSEVANALARRGTIAEEISADQDLVQAATTSLSISTARYQRGSDTYLNVLLAQRTLYSAQQTLISIRLTQATNLVTIYKTLGGGGDINASLN